MSRHKQPVQFRPFQRTRYAYDKLKICRRCDSVTALPREACASCGRRRLVHFMVVANSKTRWYYRRDLIFALLLLAAAVSLAPDSLSRVLILTGGIVMLLILWSLQRKLYPWELRRQLRRTFKHRIQSIEEGLAHDREEAANVRQDDEQRAYEMLREIAVLKRDDRIRLQQLALLQSFILRKDMDLELDSLLLRSFDPVLVDYIGEIAKIKRELVRSRTLLYVTFYERRILELPGGLAVLVAVAAAAVGKKKYVAEHADFICRYAADLPEDRFMRLHRIVTSNRSTPFGDLMDEVVRIHKLRNY